MAIFIKKATINLKSFNRNPLKLPAKQRYFLIKILAEMYEQGFSIHQSLQFLKILMPNYHLSLDYILEELNQGRPFEYALKQLGYSSKVVAQLFFSQKQGRFQTALWSIANYLKLLNDYRNKLIKALIYPIILFIFLIALLFGIRAFMLPQILSFISAETFEKQVFARLLILFFTYLPQIFLGGVGLLLLIYLCFDFYLLKLELMDRLQRLIKIPLLKKLIKNYYSYRIAEELGYFLSAGFSIQQILELLIHFPIDPFLSEIAKLLQKNYIQGIPLPESLEAIGLFNPSLPLVIYQGEITSQTGLKCQLYAKKTFNDLLENFNQKIQLIQPFLFILIALVVMAVYLILMLPMLSMEI
ncbi:competence type IV pilus assembly protein ComGB [Facklamia hominis]|uniref:Type II secretion system protein GspF domain-containing protein n=1 Tax=Facklamia hominis CCUG 36813 TaxID=883111 RepID=K1MBL7_9LACT|nr:competence type IV pilus assembly protein ComGB [Facklamia hominis]EKB53414.1 hypothetical protein HMPREF9706_01672 [Facklamia hominis CCUG 36813]